MAKVYVVISCANDYDSDCSIEQVYFDEGKANEVAKKLELDHTYNNGYRTYYYHVEEHEVI